MDLSGAQIVTRAVIFSVSVWLVWVVILAIFYKFCAIVFRCFPVLPFLLLLSLRKCLLVIDTVMMRVQYWMYNIDVNLHRVHKSLKLRYVKYNGILTVANTGTWAHCVEPVSSIQNRCGYSHGHVARLPYYFSMNPGYINHPRVLNKYINHTDTVFPRSELARNNMSRVRPSYEPADRVFHPSHESDSDSDSDSEVTRADHLVLLNRRMDRLRDGDLEHGEVPASVNSGIPSSINLRSPLPFIDGDGQTCAICLEGYFGENGTSNGQIAICPCQHKYHTMCIGGWMTDNSTCPVCRTAV